MVTRSNPCRAEGIMTPNEYRQFLGLDTLEKCDDAIRRHCSPSTTHMKPLICERCYGTINLNTMQCEYCGTRFVSGNVDDYDRITYLKKQNIALKNMIDSAELAKKLNHDLGQLRISYGKNGGLSYG